MEGLDVRAVRDGTKHEGTTACAASGFTAIRADLESCLVARAASHAEGATMTLLAHGSQNHVVKGIDL